MEGRLCNIHDLLLRGESCWATFYYEGIMRFDGCVCHLRVGNLIYLIL